MPDASTGRLAAARTLVLDRYSAAAAETLDAAGVPFLLLKGPAVATAFYDVDEFRAYRDIDLLVPADSYTDAVDALVRAGWHRPQEHYASDELAISGENLIHRAPEGQVQLDLHHTFHGVRRPALTWSAFAENARCVTVAGRSLPAPALPVQGLIAALHATTATAGSTAHEDLRRAVTRLPPDQWQVAADAARRLGCDAALAEALRIVVPGTPLLGSLSLADLVDPEVHARRSPAGAHAITWYRIRSAASLRAQLAMVLRKVFPTPAYARMQLLSAGETLPLPLYYLRRCLRLLRKAVPVLLASRRRT